MTERVNGNVISFNDWRMRQNPASCMTADELVDLAMELDCLRLALMAALVDMRTRVGDGRRLPIADGLFHLRCAMEVAMTAAAALADHCDNEIERRIRR